MMSAVNNIPRDIHDSVREILDHRIKICIKRMVKQEIRADKIENKVLAFSPCRLFVLTAKVPSKVEHSFHFLDIQCLESKKINQLCLTVDGKVHTFISLEPNTDEINNMITHIGFSLKQIFPAFPIERLIVKLEVTPVERLHTLNDMVKKMESRDVGPCGGFTTQYACMCDYHGQPFREEVAWDVDTIYLSQDSRELCLRDFDHLSARDSIPIISALEHNTWFTALNASNIRLSPEACTEILKVMRRNAVIEQLNLANTGIKMDFVQKLSTALLSNSGTQLSSLDLSGNLIEDRGVTHLMGTLKNLARGLIQLDLSRTGVTTRCLSKVADTISGSQTLLHTLQTLRLAENGQKGEDIAGIYTLLAHPNTLTTLDLSNTECAMDSLVDPLLRGCPHLSVLCLSRTTFTHKRLKETVIPVSWKQFFASTCSLKSLDVSCTKLPPEAVKELLLGIASNRHLKELDLDLSSNELGSQGAQVISGCIANIQCISHLDLSNNCFDTDLKTLLPEIAKNRHLKHLAIGRNFSSVKPKYMWSVLEAVVQLIQEEETMLESLSLADSKLKQDIACIINALGSNSSLTYVDLSGNGMGDYGARMLSKALQINNRLHTVVWDKNAVSAQGFEDIADALQKNYTLKQMPFPVNDAVVAMKTQAERTEAALQKVEQLLQRNHSPRKFASDQQCRLQQGFLINSTQQMVDRLCVQVQDVVNAVKINDNGTFDEDLEQAAKVIKDAHNSQQLLPKLHLIAMQAEDAGNSLDATMQTMASKLQSVMEDAMQKSVEDMLKCTGAQCEAVMSDKAFRSEVETGSKSRSSLPKDFAKLVLNSVMTDVFNKLSELNLAVAAYISDSVIDEVINKLTESHKDLTNHLNLGKMENYRDSAGLREQPEKTDTESEKEKEDGEESENRQSEDSSKFLTKKKSVFSRKLRPQSVVDHDATAKELRDGELVSEGNLGKEEMAAAKCLSLPEDKEEDELDGPENKCKVTDRGKESSRDNLMELPKVQVQKLEHLNKGRPKRMKTKAPTRPVAPGFGTEEESEDIGPLFNPKMNSAVSEAEEKTKDQSKDNNSVSGKATVEDTPNKAEKKKWTPMIRSKDKVEKKDEKEKKEKGPGFSAGFSNLFRAKGNKADAKEKEKEKKPETVKSTDSALPQKTETSKVYTRTSRAESPKSQRPSSTLSATSVPTVTMDTKVVVDSPKVLAPRASEESLDDEPEEPSAKATGQAGEVKQIEEDKAELLMTASQSSLPGDVEEKKETVSSAEAQEKAEGVDKVEELSPSSRAQKGPPLMGFGANVMADLKAQKRFSTRLPSPEESKADKTNFAVQSSSLSEGEKKEETNNNVLTEKEEPAKKEKLYPKAALTPPIKLSSMDFNLNPRPAPRALLPPKKLGALDSTSAASGHSVKSDAETASSNPTPKPRPTPPAKPKPPVTAPKPSRPSSRIKDSPPEEDVGSGTGKAANPGEKKAAEGEIVYDSSTLRLSVKDKIKRLSQVKLEPPPSSVEMPKRAASLPVSSRLPDSVSEGEENCQEDSMSASHAEIKENGEEGSKKYNGADQVKDADPGCKTSHTDAIGDDEIMV